ncbi:phosphatidic acid phosphatase type 2/haloperoxidase [Pavlovales sp. CCMP2436]|nr:phosphatidic acid phosphatase type 2/haloperoxidase [Pavlovales sp. CCMP2436]
MRALATVTLCLILFASSAATVGGSRTCSACRALNPIAAGTASWVRQQSKSLSCASDAHEEMRDESTKMMIDSMDTSGHVQYTGQHWDMRSWRRPNDKQLFYPWVFSKTLKHDAATGLPSVQNVTTLLAAVQCPSAASVAAIVLNPLSQRKLEGIVGGFDFTMMGGDPRAPHSPIVWPVDSAEHAFEMAEVYAMQLLRDTKFTDWESSPKVHAIVDFLNGFAAKTTAPTVNGQITPRTLLRGGGVPGSTIGPYVSQFMLHDFWYGGTHFVQKFNIEPDTNNGLTWQGWLDIQDGVTKNLPIVPAGEAVRARSGRLLERNFWRQQPNPFAPPPHMSPSLDTPGSNVHSDAPFSWYFNAAQIAVQMDVGATGIQSSQTSSWATAGDIDVFASVSHVSLVAMRVAWHNKWSMIMKIRPEVFAQRLELARRFPKLVNGRRPIPGLAAIQQNMQAAGGLLQMVLNDNKNRTGGQESLLLALQYPEGSPTHPSHPSGHATVAGACVTVLKAMLETLVEGPSGELVPLKWGSATRKTVQASALGDALIAYEGEDAAEMTVNGELNKLASNVAHGRAWAGVHFRTDALGLRRQARIRPPTRVLVKLKWSGALRDYDQKSPAAVPPITHSSSAALSPSAGAVPEPHSPHASSADATRLYETSPASPEGAYAASSTSLTFYSKGCGMGQ